LVALLCRRSKESRGRSASAEMPRTAPAATPGVSTDEARATIDACVRFATVARDAVCEEGRREREATVSARDPSGARPREKKPNSFFHRRPAFGRRVDAPRDARKTVSRNDEPLDQPEGTRRGRSRRPRGRLPGHRRASRDIEPRSVPPRRIARGAHASSAPRSRVVPRRVSRSKNQKPSFLSSRVAPASTPRARHARPRSRGSPPGGGTSRSRHEKSERTTWRNARNLTRRAQSSASAKKGTGHLEAPEPRTRIPCGRSAPCPAGGGTSH
jgi:hypothetical protein